MKQGFSWPSALLGLLAGALGGAVVWLLQHGSLSLTPVEMTYEQLAAVLLTGASVLITLIGVFLAVLALWGYGHFKTMAQDAAQTAAIKKIEDELQDGEVKRQIEITVTRFLEEGSLNGTLQALLEERAIESKALKTLDDEWSGLSTENNNAE